MAWDGTHRLPRFTTGIDGRECMEPGTAVAAAEASMQSVSSRGPPPTGSNLSLVSGLRSVDHLRHRERVCHACVHARSLACQFTSLYQS